MDNVEHFDAEAWMGSFAADGVSEPPRGYGEPPRKRNAVVEETFALSLSIMDYCERLAPINRVFADQILRSGTSPGSQVREAQNAESAADFLHKMKIGFKELEETDYRVDLCHCKAHYPHDEELVMKIKRLFPLFNSIIHSTRQRINERKSK